MKQTGNRDPKTGKFLRGNQAAVKHCGHAFLVTGRVPSVRGARALKKELARIRRELEGCFPKLDVKKSLLVNQVVRAEGFCSLFEAYCKRAGIIEPHSARKKVLAFQPGFQTYLSLLNLQRNAIHSLGLDEKKSEEILTPFEIIEKEKGGKNENKDD